MCGLHPPRGCSGAASTVPGGRPRTLAPASAQACSAARARPRSATLAGSRCLPGRDPLRSQSTEQAFGGPPVGELTGRVAAGSNRAWLEMHQEALNQALEGIPEERMRCHVCLGSWPGPHTTDVELCGTVELILKACAGAYVIEGGHPRHAHEWRVWEDVRLLAGRVLVPGVISHATHIVEHPERVAERIVRLAAVVGREHVIAGTDRGFAQGPLHQRVHPGILWTKLETPVEGARLASRRLCADPPARRDDARPPGGPVIPRRRASAPRTVGVKRTTAMHRPAADGDGLIPGPSGAGSADRAPASCPCRPRGARAPAGPGPRYPPPRRRRDPARWPPRRAAAPRSA